MDIRLLDRAEIGNAAALLSRGMCHNPVNVAAFGGPPEERESNLASFFQTVLEGQFERGDFEGAFDEGLLIGVCAVSRPGCCQPGVREKVHILSGLLRKISPGVAFRVSEWAGEWARHDPKDPHWHLGPIAVEPTRQGRGIGSALLKSACNRIDQQAAMLYLETDKEENLQFYEKHGFEVVGESAAIHQPCWYMARRP